MEAGDVDAADSIMRIAFGTFFEMPQPETSMGDRDFVRTRWLADPKRAFVAEVDGEVVGSNFATRWGSVGFFGPLTVRPELWDKGIAKQLMEPIVDCFAAWNVSHAGLFTFADSPKHAGLYQRFGFWPRFLTAMMEKPVALSPTAGDWNLYSHVSETERGRCLTACRELTGTIYRGLDVCSEIQAVEAQHLGDTVLLWERSQLVGLAVCQYGAGTEGGSESYYMKFAAARSGEHAKTRFAALLSACEQHAFREKLPSIVGGVNMGRHEAYRAMLGFGFRTQSQGIAMQRDNEPGYNHPGSYVIDDWR